MTPADHAGICARWVNHSDQVNVSQTYDETRPCTCGSYQEVLSDAYREGFGAGIESADSDRDEAIAAAERRGYEKAVANLRDDEKFEAWRSSRRHQPATVREFAARYLDATKETTL